jgi:hypothetical protein
MGQSYQPESLADTSLARPAGIVIALAAMVMIAFMAHHPLASPGDTEHFIQELGHHAAATAIVHGVLIGTLGCLLIGFTGLADRLGWSRLSVRAGLVAYAIGSAAMTAAALGDGFILPSFAAHYVDAPVTSLEAFRASAHLLSAALASAARLGVFCLSLAVFLWSLALVSHAKPCLASGALGLIAGVIPIVLLLTGRLPVDFYGMLAFVVAQACWYLVIGIQLIRRQL